jgi:hypothetical protein
MTGHERGWSPDDASPEFWSIIEKAGRDRSKLRELLATLDREQLIGFYRDFRAAAEALTSSEHLDALGDDATEDDVDDITRWSVAQGERFFRNVYEHPEKMPTRIEPHSKAHFYDEILTVFYERFGEELWVASQRKP